MLARFSHADGKLRMQGGRRDHVDDVDVGIVRDLLQVFVVVNVFLVQVVLGSPLLTFFRMSGDDPGQIALLGLL